MSNLIKGKFQSFTNNGKTKVNCLVSMKELQRIAADDGYVAFTIIPQSDDFKENKEHVKKYGDHYASKCTQYNIKLGYAIKKAKELAERTIMEPEIAEKEAESFLSEQELDHLYTNYTDDSYEV
tara:strand:+ start:351 stop:722 length:372 start_codon:yes stop_codon:yes gene_type:complete